MCLLCATKVAQTKSRQDPVEKPVAKVSVLAVSVAVASFFSCDRTDDIVNTQAYAQ